MTNIIGERIKKLRITNSLNQREFARRTGISQPTLSCYENGTALPSIDVLISIALNFGVSIDWLCGVSREISPISNLGDFIQILFELDKAADLRFEIEVDDHLPNDTETNERKWYAAIKFLGNDRSHPRNADICTFLSTFKDSRQAFETYFANKEQYDWWQKYMIERYEKAFLTRKKYENISEDQRIFLRNELARKSSPPSTE